MNILGKELSERFERVYYSTLEGAGKSIEFLPLSRLGEVSQQDLRGARHTDPLNPNTVVIYLNTDLSDEEFELTAVHELCHELVRLQGIGFQFRVEGVQKHLLPQVMQEAARLTNCFSHVAVCLCMKKHGHEIAHHDSGDLDRISEFIRQRKQIDKTMFAAHAIEYISHLYRRKYDCVTIDVNKMAELLNKWQPGIIDMANRLLKQLPDVDITSALGCYQATKALRDAIGKEYQTDLGSIVKFRNPETGQPE